MKDEKRDRDSEVTEFKSFCFKYNNISEGVDRFKVSMIEPMEADGMIVQSRTSKSESQSV